MQAVREARLAMNVIVSSSETRRKDKKIFKELSIWLKMVEERAAKWDASSIRPPISREQSESVTVEIARPGVGIRTAEVETVSPGKTPCQHLFERVRSPDCRGRTKNQGKDDKSLAQAFMDAKHSFGKKFGFQGTSKEFSLAVLSCRLPNESSANVNVGDELLVLQVSCIVHCLRVERFEIFVAVMVLMASFDRTMPKHALDKALAVMGRELYLLDPGCDRSTELAKMFPKDELSRFEMSALANWVKKLCPTRVSIIALCTEVVDADLIAREKCKENSAVSRLSVLESIEWHPQGAITKTSKWQQYLALLYVISSFMLSLVVGVANFGNRDGIFERISDVAQTATVLLVSIFGLVKLTSEDDNAIRNVLFGHKVLRTARDVQRVVGAKTERELRIMIAQSRKEMKWLDPDRTSYATGGASGTMKLKRGMELLDFVDAGWRINGNRMVQWDQNPDTMKSLYFTCDRYGFAYIFKDDKHVYPDFGNFNCPIEVR
eukprot:Plantae.Rhodophyta-Palmaria_palmata.ctg7306.p1 GENE.Plantae.Rhodophyta-Palmaria_palmata.ctg7306~~Plantae.Rhodophyta-Palmaria_palmata.ctg7306.p1  ORF type:complete len:492 (-),score=65.56 Plantae.Rhodophyta-Palmaria_palmata.ctg7306:80-1555(-)